jgi:hypothetical protein
MTRNIYESQTVRQTYSAIVGFSQSYSVLVSTSSSGICMARYDSDVALVRVLVVLGFLLWLPTDVYL